MCDRVNLLCGFSEIVKQTFKHGEMLNVIVFYVEEGKCVHKN